MGKGAQLLVEWYKDVEVNGEIQRVAKRSEMDINKRYLTSQTALEWFIHEQLTDYNRLGKKVFRMQIVAYDWSRYRDHENDEKTKDLHPFNEDMIEEGLD